MAVDITLLFRASVKTVKTRNKALGVAVGGGADGSRDELFRRSPRPKGDFSSRAREVISHIGKLRDFLLEHRKEYINAYSHTMSEYGRMTDTERDQIDQDAQIFIRTCSEAIQQLRTEAHKEIHSQQVKEHRTAVLDFVEDYLKRVCKLYSEQRAIRVKRVVDKKRLRWGGVKKGICFGGKITAKYLYLDLSWNLSQIQRGKNPRLRKPHRMLPKTLKKSLLPKSCQKSLWPKHSLNWEPGPMAGVKMSCLQRRYRWQIEGKVVEISRLQEIFTEKVLQQETEIDNIHQLVVGATENIKEGNEDIREAIKNNAGFRVWILFFLVMCSFSLLFLDWYDS
ncbi:syntaxin-18 isoform X3 [Microtus ochrogaster]|uniref:Syntaxin-18 isoform X3 n=1 Tax=Microtus ochrogaster TaxID=79684 RepID=A0ABM1UR03_MICOH|nr:syntaxin-18 isoform X3 [Microtus ochrogaster]